MLLFPSLDLSPCREPDTLDRMLGATSEAQWALDRTMSEPWLPYTKENPGRVNGHLVWEVNPILAGHPERFPPFIRANRFVERRLNLCLPDPIGKVFMLYKIAAHHEAIAYNNRVREDIGLSPLWGLGVTVSF